MPDHVVTDEKGQVHRFPEEATPAMIAQALGVSPPGAQQQQPNLQTGQGMEQQAVQQSRQQMAAPVMQAAQEHEAKQARLAYLQNRAMRSPTPFSNAMAVMAPVAAARAIAGAKVGGYAGEKVAPWMSSSPEAPQWGNAIGGLVGGTAASYTPGGASKAMQRITRGPSGTADVSVSPLTIASRELEGVVPRNTDIPGPSGGALPAADEFYANKGADLMKRGAQQSILDRQAARAAQQEAKIPPWQKPTHEEIPFGSPDNPGPFNKVPPKVPPAMRGDPFNPGKAAPKPSPFPNATSTNAPIGNQELPLVPQGGPTPFPPVKPMVSTGGAAKPFEPLIYESEAEANQIAQRNANLKRQASAAGTYHAAQGSANKPKNLQQRIGRKFPWMSEEDQ